MERYQRMVITPEMAMDLLERSNPNNRNIALDRIRMYVSDMRNGRWDEGACSPIVFNEDGMLVDGHHRLRSVALAGVSVEFPVITGASNKSFLYDRGRGRSTKDILVMRGRIEKSVSTNHAISIVKFLLRKFITNRKQFSDLDIEVIMLNYLDELKKTTEFVKKGKNHPIGASNSVFGAAVFVALISGVDEGVLEQFCVILNTGIYSENWQTAPIILRNSYMEDRANPRHTLQNDVSKNLYFRMTQEAIRDFDAKKARRNSYTGKTKVYSDAFTQWFKENIEDVLEKETYEKKA